MNTQKIQINRQKAAAFLLAGSILAAGLAWAGPETSSSTLQPTQMEQSWFQLRAEEGGKIGGGTDRAETGEYAGELSPESHLNAVKGGAAGGIVGSNR